MNQIFIGLIVHLLLVLGIAEYSKRVIYGGADIKEFKKELEYLATLPTQKNRNDLKSKSIEFHEGRLIEIRFLFISKRGNGGLIFSKLKVVDTTGNIHIFIVPQEDLSLSYILNRILDHTDFKMYAGWNTPGPIDFPVVFVSKAENGKILELMYEINGMCLYKKF